jgi:hypothetical protein
MLVTRKASEEDGLRFQVVSVVDGLPVNLDVLGARMVFRIRKRGE